MFINHGFLPPGFYPYKKKGGGGDRERFSHPGGGSTTSFGVVLTRVLKVLNIVEWGGGAQKVLTLLRGGVNSFTLFFLEEGGRILGLLNEYQKLIVCL